MESTVLKYDGTAKLLHWLSAAVIFWAMLSGLLVGFLSSAAFSQQDYLREVQHSIANFNVSLTILFMPFFVWRVIHALKTKKPSYCQKLPRSQVKIASLVHLGMYVLIAMLLCSGILMMNRPFGVLGLWSIEPIITDQTLQLFFGKFHKYSSYVLLAFIVMHLAALAKHQHSGNKIMQRML